MNPELPPKLSELINKSLEKDHKLRYQHAADIRADLQALKRDRESSRAAVAAAETESKPKESLVLRWATVAATAVLVIGLAIGALLFHTRKADGGHTSPMSTRLSRAIISTFCKLSKNRL